MSEEIGETPGDASAVEDDATMRRTRPGAGSRGVLGVPIEVLVSVGKARPLVSHLVSLRRDSVLVLDSLVEDPVEIYIGERLIARGELQESDDGSGQLAVRLTEIEDLSNGV